MDLRGKTVIVTGSGSGIGRTLALEFSRQGAKVVCCARREAKIKETVSLIEQAGGEGLAVATDITVKEQVDRMVEETIARFGTVDVLYNNAGSFRGLGGVWEVDPEMWWQDVTVNLLGPMLCCRAVLPYMMERNEGVIINMDGGGSTGPMTGGSGYGSSKAAMLRLTDGLAAELEAVGSSVLVFSLGPGLVHTDMTELQATDPAGVKWLPSTKEMIDNNETRSPMECANAAVKLLRIACPELNGRMFEVTTDFDKVAARLKDIKDNDLLTLRYRPLKD